MTNKDLVRIEDWTWFNGSLAGAVYGHPVFEDGRRIITSKLKSLDLENGYGHTKNTTYLLGKSLPSATVLATAVEE
jgi:hypothetical protein